MRIIKNRLRVISSRLAHSMAELVSKNDNFQLVFGTIVLKVQDNRQCVKQVSSMRAVLLPQ